MEAEAENLPGLFLMRAYEEDMEGAPSLEKMLTGQNQLLLVYRHNIELFLLHILFRGR